MGILQPDTKRAAETAGAPTGADPADPVAAALAAQNAIVRCLHTTTIPDWIQLDLSIGQLKTLMSLDSEQTLNVTALAELLRIGKPAASILVDRLVQLGYVSRAEDRGDRRRTLLTLAPAGAELVALLRQGAGQGRFARWLEQLDAVDLAALTRGLQALAAIAARETTAPDSTATSASR